MILITRPIEQAKTTKYKLKKLGYDAVCYPFLKIEYKNIPLTNKNFDALIVTSQNAALAIRGFNHLYNTKAFAVGSKTALILKQSGFAKVVSADGDSNTLVSLILQSQAQNSNMLYLHGDYVAGELINKLEPFYFIEDLIVYRSIAKHNINKKVKNLLHEKIRYILFYSPRTAKVFANLTVDNYSNISAICISKNTANELKKLDFQALIISNHPSEDAMLELLNK
jgi:uroporphyrinogen-III synthase